jgi:hypothetical protein
VGGANDQRYAFQFGVAPEGEPVLANTTLLAPFPAADAVSDDQGAGIYVGTGDQDNFVATRVVANGGQGGVELLREVDGQTTTVATVTDPGVIGPTGIDLRLRVDPDSGDVIASYVRNGTNHTVGRTSVPPSWFDGETAPAVGIIATSAGPANPFAATFDDIRVTRATDQVSPPPLTDQPQTTAIVTVDRETPSGDGPGFGLGMALLAVAVSALAVRRLRK